MSALIILEILNTMAWAFILTLLLIKRKSIPVNTRWLGIISGVFMVLAGVVQDIYSSTAVEMKSVLWLVASAFIVAFYITIINRCCKSDNKHIDKKLNEFIEKIERDKKELL